MGKSTSATPRKITVLLVDQDITFASIVQQHLQRFQGRKFNLIWKESAEEALKEIQQNQKIHVILTDFSLPGTNGLEFFLQLNEKNIRIPVVFATSTRELRNAIEAMKLGVEDYILKDELSESLLPRTIVNAFERATRRDQTRAVEKQMLLAQKRAEAIRELVVTVCHEFNNPLAAIKISTDLLLRQNPSEKERNLLRLLEKEVILIEEEVKRLRDVGFDQGNEGGLRENRREGDTTSAGS
ncbi:MAG: response regulator [Ignavibacteria bacterium]|nr:response regulator [Ignavibacteria bacterium]